MKTSDQSLRFSRLWLAIGWLLVLFVIYLSVTPAPVEIPGPEGDKAGHLLAYATLMAWFSQVYRVSSRRLQIACAFIALAVGLEFVQRYIGYRTFEIFDMLASAAGVLVGWAAAPPRGPAFLALAERRFQKRRNPAHGL